MKKAFYLLFVCFISMNLFSQTTNKPDTKWFEDARFGMFIHFGPYSVLGNGEWIMNTRPIKAKDYRLLQDFFNPQEFDATEWVRVAKNAGMKYITLTSRHHDGFSNWDTKQSDWNIMNTPYGKDLIKQLAEECRKEGIKLSFYYSLLDWTRDDYQWTTGRTGKTAGRDSTKINWESYTNFMEAQLTELLTNYGPVGAIWFDGHWDQTDDSNRTSHEAKVNWHYSEIYDLIHSLQPECLVANNHHLPAMEGEDFQIFERDVPGENKSGFSGQEVSHIPLETCETVNNNWGFSITDDNYKPTKDLLHLLIRTAGTGANLLLNVGPMPNGKFPQECIERLQEVGKWIGQYGYTIYGTQQGFVPPQEWGASTRKGNTYYIHILDNKTSSITLNITDNIKSARWINVPSKLDWKKDKKTDNVIFAMPKQLYEIDSIIEIILR